MTPRQRRSQAERTAETTGRLLEAAAETLNELGWAGTTTTEVCRRAGVSRGALLHHYPTRLDLVTAAARYVVHRRAEEFRAALATLPPGTDLVSRLETAIDVLWGIYQGPTAQTWLQLAVAARTEPELRPAVESVAAELQETISQTWLELFAGDSSMPPAFFELAPRYLFALLDGLAVQRMSSPGGSLEQADEVLAATKVIVRTILGTDPAILTAHFVDITGDAQ